MRYSLKYSNNIVTDLLNKGLFEELALFYLLKTLHTNGKIYYNGIGLLYAKLRATKVISCHYSQNKLYNAIKTLVKENLITFHSGYFQLTSIKEKSYYKSKIKFSKNTNFQEMKQLLILEYLKHSSFKQENAKKLNQLVNNKNKKHKISKKRLSAYDNLSEVYNIDKVFITYNTIAKNFNISLKQTYNLVQSLIRSRLLEFQTIVINHRLKLQDKLENVLPVLKYSLNLKGYCFQKNGFLFEILGSEIILK